MWGEGCGAATAGSPATPPTTIDALDIIEQHGREEEIPMEVAHKSVDDNSRAFSGL